MADELFFELSVACTRIYQNGISRLISDALGNFILAAALGKQIKTLTKFLRRHGQRVLLLSIQGKPLITQLLNFPNKKFAIKFNKNS